MTVRNPLFEFMPYGAPELLSAERTHMIRALALASLLALGVFVLARMLDVAIPRVQVIEMPAYDRAAISIAPPPSFRVETQVVVPKVVPTAATHDGHIVAVHDSDKLTPTEIVMPSTGDAGVADSPGEGLPSSGIQGADDFIPESLPERTDPIYVDELPALAKIVKPEYPELARDLGIEGRVYVHMLVGKEGRVIRAEVDEKMNVPMLNKAALDAARQWVFQPALVNKHPVAVWVAEAFIFKINQ